MPETLPLIYLDYLLISFNEEKVIYFLLSTNIFTMFLARALHNISQTFDRFDLANFKLLFTTYVRPHFEYCVQAVGPYMAQDIRALEQVQRWATKLVKKIRHLPYPERLRRLRLPSIEDRLCRGDLIETYKLLTGKVKVDYEQFFELEHQDRTRGHCLKLKKRRSKHLYRLKFFSNRVVNQWNSLPSEVVEASTVNMFKNKLDQFWAASSST